MIRGKYENMADKKKWRVWGCLIMTINPMRPMSMVQVPCVLLHGSWSQIYWCLHLQINDCNRFYMEVWKYNKVYKISSLFITLTHLGQHKIAAIWQMTFWNACSWMKMLDFWLWLHWCMRLGGLVHNVAPLVQGPFSIPYLEAQVTWIFGEIPSAFGCWLGDILDRSNIIICNFVSLSIHICDIMWYVLQYMYERQSEFSSLMNYVFDATGSDSIVGYLLVHGLLWCCIQWRHYSNGLAPNMQQAIIWASYASMSYNWCPCPWHATGLILGLRPANQRCCYKVTPSLIGWAQT